MSIQFDQNTAKKLEVLYQSRDAKKRRKAVLDALQLQAGEQVLDIGAGLGHLTLEMAQQIGMTGKILGVDLNEPMLELARQRCQEFPWIEFKMGDALNIPVKEDSFDVAVSVQVYEYIKDIPQVLNEMYRILKPGGRGIIVATDWKSILWHSNVPDRMKRVLSVWEEHCAHSDLPRFLSKYLKQAGLKIKSQSPIVQFNSFLNPDAYSYSMINFIRPFAEGKQGLTKEDLEAWADELDDLEKKGEYFFCLNQFLFEVEK